MNKKQEEKLRRLGLSDRKGRLDFDYLLWKDKSLTENARTLLSEEIIQHKKEYRNRLRRKYGKRYEFKGKDGNGYGEIVNYGGDWDGCWRKVFFPDEHWTDEEKKDFVAAVWIPYKPTYYDCTGQLFTWAVDVFNTPNGVVAYIHDHLDV